MADRRPEFRIPLSKRTDRKDRTYYLAHLNFPAMLITQDMTVLVHTDCREPVLVVRPTQHKGSFTPPSDATVSYAGPEPDEESEDEPAK